MREADDETVGGATCDRDGERPADTGGRPLEAIDRAIVRYRRSAICS